MNIAIWSWTLFIGNGVKVESKWSGYSMKRGKGTSFTRGRLEWGKTQLDGDEETFDA